MVLHMKIIYYAYLVLNGSATASPPRSWLRAAPESPELEQFLIPRVHGHIARLGATIAGAEFVGPEPHSKRIRLLLRLRREILHGATLQHFHVVEFAVHDRLCDACGRARVSPDRCSAVVLVQVRQRASHRRTLLHLDRRGAADSALRVDASAGGLDFYFASRYHAARLVSFVSSAAPVSSALSTAAHLVSHGNMSNSCSFKHAIAVELCPICRDDLIFLPREASRGLGGLGRPLVLCVQVTSQIRLLDINNMRVVVLGIKDYDRYRFEPMLTSRRLVEYVVLADHVEHDDPSGHVPVIGSGYAVTWVQVARASDLGKNDTVFTVKTHIGYQLEPGDRALGYDLCSVNSNNQDLESYNGQSHKLPDVVLVKKTYNYKKGAGKMEIQDGSERGCAEIEKLAMGMGRMDLNQSDEKELDELLEDLTF